MKTLAFCRLVVNRIDYVLTITSVLNYRKKRNVGKNFRRYDSELNLLLRSSSKKLEKKKVECAGDVSMGYFIRIYEHLRNSPKKTCAFFG
jgi:hypothetical protein